MQSSVSTDMNCMQSSVSTDMNSNSLQKASSSSTASLRRCPVQRIQLMPGHCHATPKALCLTSHSVTNFVKLSSTSQLSGSEQQQPSWAGSTHPTQPTCCTKVRLAQASRPLSCVWHRAMLRPPGSHQQPPGPAEPIHFCVLQAHHQRICMSTCRAQALWPWQPNTHGALHTGRISNLRHAAADTGALHTDHHSTRCCLATKPKNLPYLGNDQASSHPLNILSPAAQLEWGTLTKPVKGCQ
jgi:hypothetical protein